jgi:hypothetical protein
MVLQALKDRIYDDGSNYATRWLAELPHVVWGLKTQVSSATGFSPFFLVYRSEAILPTDVTFEAPLIQFYEEERLSKHVASTSSVSKNKDSPLS